MTVRDFITRHPEATLDLLTPGGYVYLTPEQTKAMLQGKSTVGHPGDPTMGMKVTAEELLPQEVCSTSFSKGTWHMMTDYAQGASAEHREVNDMTEKAKECRLRERIKENYEAYIRQLKTKPASDLIEMASEIAAAKFVYEELMVEGYFSDCADYLLEFENPLEAAVQCWIEDQDYDHHEDLEHALWIAKEIELRRAAPYPVEAESEVPRLSQGVTMC